MSANGKAGPALKAAIEWHAHVQRSMTLDYYVKVANDDSFAAMTKLGENYTKKKAPPKLPDT